MKKAILAVLCIAALSAACGSDGGTNTPTTEGITEGSGITIDPSANIDITKSVVSSILGSVGSSFSSATSESCSSAKALSKAVESTSLLYELCKKDSVQKTVSKTITGISGKAEFSGEVVANKISDDQAHAATKASGDFTNFGYYSASYKLTGSASMDGEANINSGLKKLCNSVISDIGSTDEIDGSMDGYEHTSGAFSVSGIYGGAIAFDLTEEVSASNESGKGYVSMNINGSAEFKSGGKTATCAISLNYSGASGDDAPVPQLATSIDCK